MGKLLIGLPVSPGLWPIEANKTGIYLCFFYLMFVGNRLQYDAIIDFLVWLGTVLIQQKLI